MAVLARQEVADRAGVDLDYVTTLVDMVILAPREADTFSRGDVRRIRMLKTLERAGLPIEGIAAAISSGDVSLEFMDHPFYDRFASLSSNTFGDVATETGIPVALLLVVREALGFAQADLGDRVREDELRIAPLIERLLATGSRPAVIERLLRVYGESMRRIAETEGDWWHSEVEMPLVQTGLGQHEMTEISHRLSTELTALEEKALLEIYHAHHEHAATKNIVENVESALAKAGVHSRLAVQPAICFLDLTGYTKLTDERGDRAAADLAEQLARTVQRISMTHGGKPVKWLGDGATFYFPQAGRGVRAALDMIDGTAGAGLPPAHVGLHAGPVLFQEGDYFGRTVNVAARIAEYARPGDVLVSQEVVDVFDGTGVAFAEIGPVELKGVSGDVQLNVAHRDA